MSISFIVTLYISVTSTYAVIKNIIYAKQTHTQPKSYYILQILKLPVKFPGNPQQKNIFSLNLGRLTGQILAWCNARTITKEALSRLSPTLVLISSLTHQGTTESPLSFPLLRCSFYQDPTYLQPFRVTSSTDVPLKVFFYESRTESHKLLFFACELGIADEGECGGRWNQLLCYP